MWQQSAPVVSDVDDPTPLAACEVFAVCEAHLELADGELYAIAVLTVTAPASLGAAIRGEPRPPDHIETQWWVEPAPDGSQPMFVCRVAATGVAGNKHRFVIAGGLTGDMLGMLVGYDTLGLAVGDPDDALLDDPCVLWLVPNDRSFWTPFAEDYLNGT